MARHDDDDEEGLSTQDLVMLGVFYFALLCIVLSVVAVILQRRGFNDAPVEPPPTEVLGVPVRDMGGIPQRAEPLPNE